MRPDYISEEKSLPVFAPEQATSDNRQIYVNYLAFTAIRGYKNSGHYGREQSTIFTNVEISPHFTQEEAPHNTV